MRRIATALGALPIAGLLTLTAPAAHAATGTLIIEGKPPYTNPSGCYALDHPWLRIINQTDQPAFIFTEPGCRSGLQNVIEPGRAGLSNDGASLLIR